MVKCIAPGNASYRGKAIDIAQDGSCELSEEALEEMRAHGFREWGGDEPEAAKNAKPDTGATGDAETMSRPELMKALKGRAKGNLMAMSMDELRRLVHEARGAKPDGGE
jgi:hypothetical protein